MSDTGVTVMSPQRGAFSAMISAVLILCNVTLAAQDVSPKVQRHPGLSIAVLELHTAPAVTTPAHGLRESSPEEIQRIEQLTNRSIIQRNNSSSVWNWFPDLISAVAICKPLLLVDHACSNANLIALAHANLNSRYPIPPPASLL